MLTALKTTTKVLAGGKVEITAPQLPTNELVEVIIVFPALQEAPVDTTKRSAMDILKDLPGHRIFHTAADVNTYVTEERETWDS